jgi:lipopolysaccharide transport system permease protein
MTAARRDRPAPAGAREATSASRSKMATATELSTPARRPLTVIEPPKGWRLRAVRELWSYRELLFYLTWRDVKIRYKQTLLGGTWAVLQPFLLMVVFTIFLGHLAGISSQVDIPYPLFAFAGLVPWTLFAQSLINSSDSLVRGTDLVSKVYFPRLILPIAAAGSFVFDFLIAFSLLVALMIWYGVAPSGAVVWLPAFTALAVAAALAVGVWLAALNVRYRDIKYAVPFLVQLWLFASPVAYPTTIVPERWRPLLGLNPMAGVVEGFRWALVGGPKPGAVVFVSAAGTILLLLGGIAYFQRVERTFADVI